MLRGLYIGLLLTFRSGAPGTIIGSQNIYMLLRFISHAVVWDLNTTCPSAPDIETRYADNPLTEEVFR